MKDSAEISRQTEAALAHHSEAFGKADIDDVLSDYTEESMLFTPTASWKTRRRSVSPPWAAQDFGCSMISSISWPSAG